MGSQRVQRGIEKGLYNLLFTTFPLNSNQDPQLHASSMTEQIILISVTTEACGDKTRRKRRALVFMCNTRAFDHCHEGQLFPGHSRQWRHESPFNAACKSTFIFTSCCSRQPKQNTTRCLLLQTGFINLPLYPGLWILSGNLNHLYRNQFLELTVCHLSAQQMEQACSIRLGRNCYFGITLGIFTFVSGYNKYKT